MTEGSDMHGGSTMKSYTSVHIRFMTKADYREVLRIENASFDIPWTEKDLKRVIHSDKPNGFGLVAEHEDSVIGYVICDLCNGSIHIANLAVSPEHRRCGIATQLVQRVIEHIGVKFERIYLEVSEHNLRAQQFFRQLEFRAVKVAKNFYEADGLDAYVMEYRSVWLPDGTEVLRSIMSGEGRVVHVASV